MGDRVRPAAQAEGAEEPGGGRMDRPDQLGDRALGHQPPARRERGRRPVPVRAPERNRAPVAFTIGCRSLSATLGWK